MAAKLIIIIYTFVNKAAIKTERTSE